MRILCTGGAGFIGSHVVDAYLAAGHEVIVVDDLSTGHDENVSPNAELYVDDIGCIDRIIEDVKPDIVNHHAAQSRVVYSTVWPFEDAYTNIIGTLDVLRACVRHNVKKVIYASTGGAVYGEPDYLPVEESHPIRPISPYGLSKYVGEEYVRYFGRNHNLNYTIFRYPNVYGPRQYHGGEAGVVSIFTGQLLCRKCPTIYGDGLSTRDYIHVSDIAHANVLALTGGEGRTVNLGSGIETTVYHVFDIIRQALTAYCEPNYEKPRQGEVDRICLSGCLAKRVLGWEPRVSVWDGIRETVRYLMENQ